MPSRGGNEGLVDLRSPEYLLRRLTEVEADKETLRGLADEFANQLVALWHETDERETRRVWEFMGMGRSEYDEWVERSGVWER